MDIESGQLGEMPIQAQGHEEARVLIGQLSMLGLVVHNPGRVNLRGRGDLQAGSHAVVEAGPAGHVRGHVHVPAAEVHSCISRRGTAWAASAFTVGRMVDPNQRVVRIRFLRPKIAFPTFETFVP